MLLGVSVHLCLNEGKSHKGGPFELWLGAVFAIVQQSHEQLPAFLVVQEGEVLSVVVIKQKAFFCVLSHGSASFLLS